MSARVVGSDAAARPFDVNGNARGRVRITVDGTPYRRAGTAFWSPADGGACTLELTEANRAHGRGTRDDLDDMIDRHGYRRGPYAGAVVPADGTVAAVLWELDWSHAGV